jgi:predicted kinase
VARRHKRPVVAIVLDLPLGIAMERNLARPEPRPPNAALRRQHRWLQGTLLELPDEGLTAIHHLRSAEEIDAAHIEPSR